MLSCFIGADFSQTHSTLQLLVQLNVNSRIHQHPFKWGRAKTAEHAHVNTRQHIWVSVVRHGVSIVNRFVEIRITWERHSLPTIGSKCRVAMRMWELHLQFSEACDFYVAKSICMRESRRTYGICFSFIELNNSRPYYTLGFFFYKIVSSESRLMEPFLSHD